MLSGLSSFSNTSFELSLSSSYDEHSTIGLRSSSNHVLDEVTMAWSIDNGEVVLGGFEFPEGNINGNSSFSLGLKFVQHPGVFERAFAHFLSLLLELFDASVFRIALVAFKFQLAIDFQL